MTRTAHIFTQQLKLIRAGEGYVPDYDAPLDTYLEKLRKRDLSHAVLIQPSFLGTDNSFLLESISLRLDRMRAMVIVDSHTSIDDLERMKAQGAVGAHLILFGSSATDFRERAWTELLDRLASLEWIVEIYAPASVLPAVAQPVLDHGCKLLVDHYGRPDPKQAVRDPGFEYLLGLARTGKVWIDISGPYRNGDGELGEELSLQYLTALRQAYGLERILWGSDWPCVRFEPWQNFESSWAFLNRALPKQEDQRAVLWDTPRSLFGFA